MTRHRADLSSTEPNLQNIPVRTDLGGRSCGSSSLAPRARSLVDADYSQIELRVLAYIAGGRRPCSEAFLAGEDIHTATAAQVFGVPPEHGHPRRCAARAKAVNFGIVYGISAFSLSQDIGVTVAEAKEYMESYFAAPTPACAAI